MKNYKNENAGIEIMVSLITISYVLARLSSNITNGFQ
jgi:hypothetical protein